MRQRKVDRHLPPCVYHKHGAYWFVRAGKWYRLGTNLVTALAEYGRRIAAPKGGMADLIEEAFPHITKKVAASTAHQYRVCANKLKEILAEFEPGQVRPRDVAGIKRLYADHPNMGNRVLSVLRSVFAYALEAELVEMNPCIGVKRHTERWRERLVAPAEFDAIREKAVPQMQVIMDMLRLTGQRVSDVLKLRVSDLGDDGIFFRQGKTGARLIVRWTPELRAAVERAKTLRGNVRALTLFHSRTGGAPAYETIRDKWERACELAGIQDAHIHDLRAMAITAAKAQGIDAQALAGHTSPAMTRRYLRSKEVPVVDSPIRQSLDIGQKTK
jgi:integrase